MAVEPGPGDGPESLGGGRGDVEAGGGFVDGQPREVAELDQPRSVRVVSLELGECLVQCEQLLGGRDRGEVVGKVDSLQSPAGPPGEFALNFLANNGTALVSPGAGDYTFLALNNAATTGTPKEYISPTALSMAVAGDDNLTTPINLRLYSGDGPGSTAGIDALTAGSVYIWFLYFQYSDPSAGGATVLS